MVYLHRPIPELKEFIAYRGRNMENAIQSNYLIKVQEAYFNFFKTQHAFPVLVLDMEGIDFVKMPKAYNKIVNLLKEDYDNKVYYMEMKI